MRSFFRHLTLGCGLAAACFASQAQADEIRTGDGLISLSAEMPDEVRIGESFEYEVKLSNASDNVVLHDIKLEQRKTKGLSIESVSMKNQGKQNDSKKESTESSSSSKEMTVSTLKPGDSRTFLVKATADEEGKLHSCLEIASYTPAVCLTSQVVKPQLELTKVAPEQANRCSMIELEYALKNGGSGDVGPVKVTDSLGEHLATIEGNSELSFEVDGLAAGETREFVARVYAQKPGEFSSRAEATATNSELSSRSKETTTKVISADLAAKLNGPNRLYGNELATFTGEVTNTGNVAAEDVRVKVIVPAKSNLVDISEPSMRQKSPSEDDSKESSKNDGNNQPTMASKQGENSSANGNSDSEQSQKSEMEMTEKELTIARLEPGQTATFDYAVRAGDIQEIPSKIVATYVCTVDSAEDQTKSTARAQSMAVATVKVVRLPAMQLMVVDDEDPVIKGDQVVYTIRVWNEGDAPDNNVKLIAELPEGLEFVSADGPTENSQDGATIQFDPIKTMEPGDRADYKVTAKCQGNKSVRFAAKLTSKKLPAEVSAEEPTRLFKR
ncbi:Large cysteine-rich periplasmic protein OmcB precursor [Roseimaritima multifibrata]|uniref:Large cysteine-rich periplasmic protein OmcB n=1 Tax=Roseimaritima multifibrata TaxID=1930274 RepID=A0A517MG88_9BACT|nr:DUF11 domain-containing protein [Roseimaritima multifibrata]QDS93903.1 Large cysteine-rich periplasmic protein OmcB precursor [Roseimaritima multifibrata]